MWPPQDSHKLQIFYIVLFVIFAPADNTDTGPDGILQNFFFSQFQSAESQLFYNGAVVGRTELLMILHSLCQGGYIKHLLDDLQFLVLC